MRRQPNPERDRQDAIEWARRVLANPTGYVILDTETTGLDTDRDEIIQIAIIDPTGQVLFESYVKPTCLISKEAQRVNRITPEMVADAPAFAEIYPRLIETIQGKRLIIYNAGFDWSFLVNQSDRAGLDYRPFNGPDCAMEWYAQFVGDYSDFHRSYRWQKLPGGDHTARGDALACLEVIKLMAVAAAQAPDNL